MSDIFVTNNTSLPIHVAMSWKGIVQDYVNYLRPNDGHHFDRFYRGRFDFTAVVATPKNQFEQYNNAMSASSLVKIGKEVVKDIDDLALVPAMGGLVEVISLHNSTPMPVLASGPTVSLNTATVEGSEGVLLPTHLKSLIVSDSYRLCIRGGDIIGHYDTVRHAFAIREITPLSIYWKNKTRHQTGTETGVSVYSCSFDD